MRTTHTPKGFTLIEIIVVVAIIAAFATVSALAFQNMYRTSTLKAGSSEVYGALSGARTKTLASEGDTVYGVRVSTTSVTRFEGPSYSAGDSGNIVYMFEGGVTATSSLISSGGNIVFARLSGEPSVYGTIYVRDRDMSATTTIIIHASGLIEQQ